MLVLERRPGEAITIGTSITVRVIRVVGNQVYLEITAPRDVPIVRDDARPPRTPEQGGAR